MEIHTYQSLARRTSAFHRVDNRRDNTLMATLGLNGEAGEVADIIKKYHYHGHQLNMSELILELGDVAWYLAELCTALGLSLEDVCVENIEKLRKRYPEHFSSEASRNRTQ